LELTAVAVEVELAETVNVMSQLAKETLSP
jgi:hypothetical protein